MARLYVGNVPYAATAEDILAILLMAPLSHTPTIRLVQPPTHTTHLGYAWVTVHEDDVEHAIEEVNGYDLQGRYLVCRRAPAGKD